MTTQTSKTRTLTAGRQTVRTYLSDRDAIEACREAARAGSILADDLLRRGREVVPNADMRRVISHQIALRFLEPTVGDASESRTIDLDDISPVVGMLRSAQKNGVATPRVYGETYCGTTFVVYLRETEVTKETASSAVVARYECGKKLDKMDVLGRITEGGQWVPNVTNAVGREDLVSAAFESISHLASDPVAYCVRYNESRGFCALTTRRLSKADQAIGVNRKAAIAYGIISE